MASQRWRQARRRLESAVGALGGVAEVWLALAETRIRTGDAAGAAVAAERALALEPGSLPALLLRVTTLRQQQRLDEALAAFDAFPAAAAAASHAFHLQHGETLRLAGQPQRSVDALMRALALRIEDTMTHCQLGFTLQALGLHAEAAECFRTVTALDPRSLPGHAYLAHWEQFACRWADFDANATRLIDAVHAAEAAERSPEYSAPFALLGLPHHPRDMLQAARLSVTSQGVQAPALPARPAAQRRPGSLRVGYLSNDFHNHATAVLLVEVLERRDRERFEVHLYSHGADDGSALRQRIAAACDRFVDVSRLGIVETARAIHDGNVDILVDLKGHTSDTRLAALSLRSAPVQVSWLGFPATTGAAFVDYFVGDPVTTPLAHAAWYSECIAQMPLCYQPNDSQRPRPPAQRPRRSAWGLPEDAFVLASFNQPYKITPRVFDVWMEILRRIKGAVLWQLSAHAEPAANLRAEAQRRGVDPARIVIASPVDSQTHLARLGAADLALDTWPCNGHTTTSDLLWAGVPVVTLQGETFASRVGSSLLAAVGLDRLTCTDAGAYADLAVALAADRERLHALREHLVHARDHAPLFDAARFARDLEALYLRMWARHEAGLPPAPLSAQPA